MSKVFWTKLAVLLSELFISARIFSEEIIIFILKFKHNLEYMGKPQTKYIKWLSQFKSVVEKIKQSNSPQVIGLIKSFWYWLKNDKKFVLMDNAVRIGEWGSEIDVYLVINL